MNSNQRSQGNNQSSNGGNEKSVSSSRGGTVEKDNLDPASGGSGTLNSAAPVNQQTDAGAGSRMGQQSTDRKGSQTGPQGAADSRTQQPEVDHTGSHADSPRNAGPGVHESNDASGGYPRSPGGANHLAADEKMDDDTGLSDRGNWQSVDLDDGSKQERQSNVGRRSDMTPD